MAGLFISGAIMEDSNDCEGLSRTEADNHLIGTINRLISDAMDDARAMTTKEWEERDIRHLPNYYASAIFYAVQNHKGA